MKVAYFGRTPSSLKSLSGLMMFFDEVHYYLLSEQADYVAPKTFNSLPLFSDKYYLSEKDEELTATHRKLYENLDLLTSEFKKLIFGSVLNEEENRELLEQRQVQHKIKKLQKPVAITYLNDEKKYVVAAESETNEYDFILTENIGFCGYCPLKKDPFTFFINKFCFFNIEFGFQQKSDTLSEFDVLSVESEHINDITQNWSIVHVLEQKIRVVVPILQAQISNQDYIDFVKNHIREGFSSQFPLLKLEDEIQSYLTPTNENFEAVRSSFTDTQIILVPDLTYWTEKQVERFILDSFSAGKYRLFLKSKEIIL